MVLDDGSLTYQNFRLLGNHLLKIKESLHRLKPEQLNTLRQLS